MADLDKVKRNVAKMVSMDAPESDIDQYIAEEGTTIDEIKNYRVTATPAPEQPSPLAVAGKVLGEVGRTAIGSPKEVMGAGQNFLGSPVGQDIQAINPVNMGIQAGKNLAQVPPFLRGKFQEGGLPAVGGAIGQGLKQGAIETGKAMVEPITSPLQYSQEHPLFQAMNVVPLAGVLKSLATAGKVAVKAGATKAFIPKNQGDALWRALEPTQTNTKLRSSIDVALPTIQSEIKARGTIPKTNKEFLSVIENKQNNLMAEKESIISKFKDEPLVDGDAIYEAMTEPLKSERFYMQNPAMAKVIEKQANFYKGNKYTLKQANDFLKESNAEANSYYTSKNLTKGTRDPEIIYKLNEAKTLRDQMYKVDPKIKPIQKLWGALDDIGYELQRKVEIQEPVAGQVLSSAKYGNKAAPFILGVADVVSGGGVKPLAMQKAMGMQPTIPPFLRARTAVPAVVGNLAGQNQRKK